MQVMRQRVPGLSSPLDPSDGRKFVPFEAAAASDGRVRLLSLGLIESLWAVFPKHMAEAIGAITTQEKEGDL
jgi:hypothetical protein